MTNQPPTTAWTSLARRTDPWTSHDAAARTASLSATHYTKVLAAMKALRGAAGAEQIAGIAGIDPYQVRKRLPELERMGFARATDETRATAAGRRERMWELV